MPQKKSTCVTSITRGILGFMIMNNHEHKVFKECKAPKEAATSLSTHDNLLYNPVLKKFLVNQIGVVAGLI